MKTTWGKAALAITAAILWTAAGPAAASGIDGCRAVDYNGDGNVDLLDLSQIDPSDPRFDLDGNGSYGNEDVSILLSFFDETCGACLADLSGDGQVDGKDLAAVEAAYGTECRPDLTRDRSVDNHDVNVFFDYLGQPAPPQSAQERADFNGDGLVDLLDAAVIGNAAGNDCRADLNIDGKVDTNDRWALLASWGRCS